jgi:sporulation protein YlmC with PRC-barrel domain
MKENKVPDLKIVWASFLDDNGQEAKGFFRLIEYTRSYVKLKSGNNILIIPFHRINKIKEMIENGK